MVKPIGASCLVIMFFLVLAGDGKAGQCANGPCCTDPSIAGPIVRPKHNVEEEGKGDINFDGLTVLSGILAIGQGLRDGSNKTAAAIDKNFETQDAYIRQLITSFGVAHNKAENNRIFGQQSKAYNTFHDAFDSGVASGLVARDRISAKARDDMQIYIRNFKTKKQILDRFNQVPSGFALGTDQTLTAQELATNKEVFKTALDPFPALNLPEDLNQKPLTQSYKSTRKAKEAQLLIPTAVFGDLLAAYAPVIDAAGWPIQVYEKMGGENESPQVIDGKLSMNGLLKILSDMRFASHDWAAGANGLHGMTKTGVLREMLLSRVDKLMIEYRNMLWLDRMAALLAQKQLSRNQEFKQALQHAQSTTMQ